MLTPFRLRHLTVPFVEYIAPLTLGAALCATSLCCVFRFEAILEQSAPTTPVVFILSPGADPAGDLVKLADRSGFGAGRIKFLSLGQGQEEVGAVSPMLSVLYLISLWVVYTLCDVPADLRWRCVCWRRRCPAVTG